MKISIELTKGIENLPFGITPEKVRVLMGEPSEVEELENATDGSVESIVWNYPEEGLNFFFEASTGEPSLCTIESDNIETLLYGKKVFELDKLQILSLMKEQGYSDTEEEDETWGEHRLTFNDAQIDFYFIDEELSLVSWSAF